VALKKITKESLTKYDGLVGEQFMEELMVWQKIKHPNIMFVHQVLQDKDNYYHECELVEDGDLR